MGLEYGVKALTDTPSREEQKTAKETLPLEAQVRRTWTHGFHVRGDLLLFPFVIIVFALSASIDSLCKCSSVTN
jgi:hypothetical protein